ncbi:MAG: TspO/MBR family protein [Candidatus Nanoarchaeia archaeon]
MNLKSFAILIALIIITQFIGGIWTPFSNPNSEWFQSLEKPFFNPPSWLFGPVWITLYLFMAISIFRIYNSIIIQDSQKYQMYFLYGFQLILNSLWTPLFFLFQEVGYALILILILLTTLLYILYKYYKLDVISFYLWVPYVLWVLFATILNLSLYVLN